MYSCPTDDIHSVYLDNELPQAYVKDYEEHIKTCDCCRKKLEKMRIIHNAFKQDSKQITLDSTYLTHSFERLQTKWATLNTQEYNSRCLIFLILQRSPWPQPLLSQLLYSQ